MFLLDESPVRPFRLPGLELVPVEVDAGTSKFDLTLRAGGRGRRRWWGGWSTRRTCSTRPPSSGWRRTCGELLHGIAADPGRAPSRALPLMARRASGRCWPRWNATDARLPGRRSSTTLFAAQAARTPDAPALVFGGETLTYAELDARANRLAHHLRGLGVGPEARVGVCLERTPELVVALLAVLKAGGAYVPLDPAYPRERLGSMIEDAGVRLVLTTAALADRLPARRGADPPGRGPRTASHAESGRRAARPASTRRTCRTSSSPPAPRGGPRG